MYQALNQDSESFCSNPSHTLDFHEHENANPPQKMEISLIVTADDSLYGLALKYNIRHFDKLD